MPEKCVLLEKSLTNEHFSMTPCIGKTICYDVMQANFLVQYTVHMVGELSISVYCQALSISQSLNLSLSLRDRDRADTIITFHHHHRKLFKHLEVTYSQV